MLVVFLRGMHGFSSGSTFFINAEVDSMGGVVDNGIGIGVNPSPCRAAIEKAQTELRLEYDVREERRRELEFLEKGGDPLDFKFGHAASVSVQSTSHNYQHPDQNVASEAKGSFALTASPHGDSVESSGRLGVTIACEPNSADNFNGEDDILQSDRKSTGRGRSSISPLEHSYQLDRIQIVNNSEDSPNSHPKSSQAYRRRNRSRSNHDGPRSSSDMASCGGHGPSLPVRHEMLSKPVESENQVEMESDGTHIIPKMTELPEVKSSLLNSKKELEDVQNPCLQVDEAPVTIRAVEPVIVVGSDIVDTLCYEYPSSSGGDKIKVNATSDEMNEICKDDKGTTTVALINNAPVTMEGLDFEPPCTLTNSIVDQNGNTDSNFCTTLKSVDSNEAATEVTLSIRDNFFSGDDKILSEDHANNAVATASCMKEDKSSIGHQGNGFTEGQSEVDGGSSSVQIEANDVITVEGQEKNNVIKSEKEFDQLGVCTPNTESSCHVRPPVNPVPNELNRNGFLEPSLVLDSQPSTENQPKSLDKAQEDRILEEAQMIEGKRKRIAELSIGLLPRECRPKCHWDLVLEEMAWLANDFAQERLWKVTASAQICRRVAFASRLRLEEQSKISKLKNVAHTLAKAVMEFWHSARLSAENGESFEHEKCKHEAGSGDHVINGYAVRFLQLNRSVKPLVKVEVSGATNVACDIDLPDVSWLDQFTEESLFYAVPPGAILTYRNSIESCLVEYERIGNNVQEEIVMSGNDAAADCGYEECNYEEDEGESFYHQPRALNTGKPSKKKRKIMKSNAARSYEFGGEFGYEHSAETKNGTAQLNVMGKRPANNLHVVIPTKRMRTASRQRVIVPFGAGPAGVTPVPSKADPSSEDTNSFQDDQSTLHGGCIIRRGSEADSKMNFEKQSMFDSEDVSVQPKKKKKIKHQSFSYDQRWQLDSSTQNEQKDLVRKRSDNLQLLSNGNGGLFGQHAKKPKLANKNSLDTSFDNTVPLSGSVASPVASQMSNLSSQTKIIKLIGGRGKKGKGLKVSCGQHGSGSPWTIVEDQALVVLVHDMGPNWELVSDAINSILQFKCIFRKPQECKGRHKILMDRPSGDGADSAEDSGSSQPYPSTLPGIPKGSARQLFRSLHAHVEEDNIKSRFEKIIRIQQMHIRKKKIDNQIALAHSSHVLSLSQVIPNNVNGGVLTPLDLCDTGAFNQDPFSTGYQNLHAGALPLPNQSSIPPMHLPNGLNSPLEGLQGSSGKGIGNNPASLPSQFISARDGRYAVPRSGSLASEEQQRLHQHKSMLPGRNVQASNLSSSGSLSGADRVVRTHPGGNSVSLMPGINRSMPMVRLGVQGTHASSMLNSGSVLASNVGGTPSNMNLHSGTASGHGNTTLRHRDSLHSGRSGQSSEHQMQMNPPEMQMHATQTYNKQTTTSPLLTYPGHVLNGPHPHLPTSNHGATPEQQAYIRISRERQMQQRLLHRQHHQHPASSTAALTTHVQAPPQLPMSSPSQPVPVTTSSLMTHSSAVPHQQQKNVQGHGRSARCGPNGMINQGAKQRQQQAQPYQQSGRQHPQRQQPQSQQSPKIMKGIENGNIVMHQNLASDPSHLNGLSSTNSTNTLPPSKPLVSPPSSNNAQPRKSSVNKAPVMSKPAQQISSRLDSGNQGQGLGSNLSSSATVMLSRDQQLMQGQPVLKVKNQSCRSANCDSLKEEKLAAPVCVNSSSNVVNTVQESVCNSAMVIESSQSGFSTSQAVTNSVIDEPSLVRQVLVVEKQLSGNNLVSDGFEAQWQQQESHLQSPPQPLLPKKQSHIHDGRSVVFTGTANSRMD